MGKKIRITRKQLKEDEIASFWAEVLHWVQGNYRSVLIGVAAAVVVLLFYTGLQRRALNRRAEANIYLSAAQVDIQAGLMAQDEKARDQRFDSAEDKLRTILTVSKSSKLIPEALYLLGNVAFYRNEYEEAQDHYRNYLERADSAVEKAQGHIALGYVYENRFFWNQDLSNRGLLDQAEEEYRTAEELTSGTAERYHAMLCRARVYDLQPGKANQALELYDRVARERKLEEPVASQKDPKNYYEVLLANMERNARLFSLAETAQIRKERLEAER